MIHFERWSLLLVGEALKHDHNRYADFLNKFDIAPSTLSARLDGLISSGLMDLVDSPDAKQQHYVLTEKGRDLQGVITALDEWSPR